MKRILIVLIGITCLMACKQKKDKGMASADLKVPSFHIEQTDTKIEVFSEDGTSAVVTQKRYQELINIFSI